MGNIYNITKPNGQPNLEILGFHESRSEGARLELPLYLATVTAGFPSPADDYIDRKLDLNEYLIAHPAATFFVRVVGDSMRDANLASGDILVVDRALEPRHNSIVVAALDGELTVKRLRKDGPRLFLMPEHPDYPALEVTENSSFEIWGVVAWIIHKA